MMSSSMRSILGIFGICAWMAVMGFVAYQAGSAAAQSFIGTGANASLQKWQTPYLSLVSIMAVVSALAAILWCALAEWGFKVNYPTGVGKRLIWGLIGAVLTVFAFAFPFAYAGSHPVLKMSIIIPVIFVVFFVLAGYWLATIFATGAAYKYTPLGAMKIRGSRGGKN